MKTYHDTKDDQNHGKDLLIFFWISHTINKKYYIIFCLFNLYIASHMWSLNGLQNKKN